MGKQRTSALLVASPGDLRDSIEALLSAMPQIGAVTKLDHVSEMCGLAFKSRAGLVLLVLDPKVSECETWLTLRGVTAVSPRVRCICLVNDVQQQEEAEAAGADAVLVTGVPAARLVATIVRLLPQPAQPEPQNGADGAPVSVESRPPRIGRRWRQQSRQARPQYRATPRTVDLR